MSDDSANEAPKAISEAGDPITRRALTDPKVSRVYANGFSVGLSNADAHVILLQFGEPTAILNMSYTLAKTLALRLGLLVAEWETRTGQVLVTTDKIDLAFAPNAGGETKQ